MEEEKDSVLSGVAADPRTTAAGVVAGGCKVAGAFYPFIMPLCEPIGGLALIMLGLFAADAGRRRIQASATDKEFTPGTKKPS